MFKFSKESLINLDGVHATPVRFCYELLKHHDFKVIDGVRTMFRQAELVHSGVSKTMNSKHLVQKDGFGHAIDLWPLVDGVFLDPDNPKHLRQWYYFGGLASMLSRTQFDGRITWGGDWNFNNSILDNSFNDLYHFQYNERA